MGEFYKKERRRSKKEMSGKKIMKKIAAMLIAAAVAFPVMGISAFAETSQLESNGEMTEYLPSEDKQIRKNNTAQVKNGKTFEVRRATSDDSDFAGLIKFTGLKQEGKQIASATLKLVGERKKAGNRKIDVFLFSSNEWTEEGTQYTDVETEVAQVRETQALASFEPAGTNGKTFNEDTGIGLEGWTNTIVLTGLEGSTEDTLSFLVSANDESSTAQTCFYTKDVTDDNLGADTLAAYLANNDYTVEDLKPVLTIVYENVEYTEAEITTEITSADSNDAGFTEVNYDTFFATSYQIEAIQNGVGFQGAQIRTTKGKEGFRFVSLVNKEKLTDEALTEAGAVTVEYGTLIIPEAALQNRELTLATATNGITYNSSKVYAAKVKSTVNMEEGTTFNKFAATIVGDGITSGSTNTIYTCNFVVRPYMVYMDADGNQTDVMYGTQDTRSMQQVAQALDLSEYSGHALEYLTAVRGK